MIDFGIFKIKTDLFLLIVAVLLFLGRLDQRGQHNANAKEITDVREVYVKIPANRLDVIKDSQACNQAHKAECAVDGLIN